VRPVEPPPAALPDDADIAFDAPVPRGYWSTVWRRFRRDRVALGCGVVLAVLLAVCFLGEPIAEHFLGHGPNDIFLSAADINNNFKPVGLWSRVPNTSNAIAPKGTPTTLFILGADGPLGRDVFLRVLDGGRTSLEIAFGAALLACLLGGAIGMVAGYVGGWADATVTRMTELIMGFPFLLFIITLGFTINTRLSGVTIHDAFAKGVVALVVLIGIFYCVYPARLVRSQVLLLREQEYIEAARMIGAGEVRIMRTHLIPAVIPSLLVYGTQLFAITIFLEAALSILGVGIGLPDASWGNIIATNYGTLLYPGAPAAGTDTGTIYLTWLLVAWPTILIFVTVLAVTLFGEGVRSAIDAQGTVRG
jgi:peptide/nickel transport system permease protein